MSKKIDIEMADMVGKTYLAVATWFNKDFDTDKDRQQALKEVSSEIIQTILEDTFLQMDGAVNTETKTVAQGTPMKTVNETVGGTGKMFEPNENVILNDNAILNALKNEKE